MTKLFYKQYSFQRRNILHTKALASGCKSWRFRLMWLYIKNQDDSSALYLSSWVAKYVPDAADLYLHAGAHWAECILHSVRRRLLGDVVGLWFSPHLPGIQILGCGGLQSLETGISMDSWLHLSTSADDIVKLSWRDLADFVGWHTYTDYYSSNVTILSDDAKNGCMVVTSLHFNIYQSDCRVWNTLHMA